MQREIKFRAWDLEKKCWVESHGTTFTGVEPTSGSVALTLDGHLRVFSAHYGGFFDEEQRHITELHHSEYESVHPMDTEPHYKRQYVLQQFTGLKDFADKEIYEGDIVQHEQYPTPLVVTWDYDQWGLFDDICNEASIGGNDVEVIGNICENPHLLH